MFNSICIYYIKKYRHCMSSIYAHFCSFIFINELDFSQALTLTVCLSCWGNISQLDWKNIFLCSEWIKGTCSYNIYQRLTIFRNIKVALVNIIMTMNCNVFYSPCTAFQCISGPEILLSKNAGIQIRGFVCATFLRVFIILILVAIRL